MNGSVMRNRYVLAVASAVCLGAAAAGCQKPPMPTPGPPEVTVAYPVQRTVVDYGYFTGTTKAEKVVDIRARVKGFLEEVRFKPTTMVKEGQELFVIEQAQFLAQLKQAEAERDAAEARRANAQIQLDQAEVARAQFRDAVSDSEMAKLKADRDAAQAAKAQAEALIAQRKQDLGYTVIRSPIDGLVGRHRVDVGNLVGASEDTLLTTVVKLDPMHAEFDVGEDVVRKTVRGQGLLGIKLLRILSAPGPTFCA